MPELGAIDRYFRALSFPCKLLKASELKCSLQESYKLFTVFSQNVMAERHRHTETPPSGAAEALTRQEPFINQNLAFDPGIYVHGDITLTPVNAIAAKDASCKLWLAITNLAPNQSV